MSILLTDSRTPPTKLGAGGTQLNLNFAFEKNTDVIVYKNEVLLDTSSYTITGAGIDPTPQTRFITFTEAALADDVYIALRSAPISRSTDFKVSGDFSAINVDKEFDRLVLMMQQINTKLTVLGLQYPEYVDDSDGSNINSIAKLPANVGNGIPVRSTNGAGDLINVLLTEDSGCSSLRSELKNDNSGTDGGRDVGFYNETTSTRTTVSAELNTLTAAVSNTAFVTGMSLPFYNLVAAIPTGWLLMDGGTLGNITSNASSLAGPTAQNLYVVLWNYTSADDSWPPVYDSVGALVSRGPDAASDWIANKAIALPQNQNKVVANLIQMSVSATFTTDFGTDASLITLVGAVKSEASFPNGSSIFLTTTDTLPTGLSPAVEYFVVFVSDDTVKLCATRDEVVKVSPTFVIFSSDGVGVQTITRTLANKSACEWLGEDTHLGTISEMPTHNHDYTKVNGTEPQTGSTVQCYNSIITTPTSNAGGSNATPNLQPTIYTNMIIKL